MKPEEKALRFFLGANTPQGFVSRFDQVAGAEDGWREMVIKGGPGSGKSTMMKKVAASLSQYGGLELIHCSSDVDSLDGVVVPEIGYAILDGTAPHASVKKFKKQGGHTWRRGEGFWKKDSLSYHVMGGCM